MKINDLIRNFRSVVVYWDAGVCPMDTAPAVLG